MIGGTPTQEITKYPHFFGPIFGFRVSAESKRPLARWRSPRSLGARERQQAQQAQQGDLERNGYGNNI